MILLCPPEKSTQFHYPLDPKKIRSEGSLHKDTTYQGSDRQDFYRHGKKLKNDEINADLDWFAIGNPVKMKIYPQVLTFFIKPKTWLFHVVVLLSTATKWTKVKNARAGRAKLLFLPSKYANL